MADIKLYNFHAGDVVRVDHSSKWNRMMFPDGRGVYKYKHSDSKIVGDWHYVETSNGSVCVLAGDDLQLCELTHNLEGL